MPQISINQARSPTSTIEPSKLTKSWSADVTSRQFRSKRLKRVLPVTMFLRLQGWYRGTQTKLPRRTSSPVELCVEFTWDVCMNYRVMNIWLVCSAKLFSESLCIKRRFPNPDSPSSAWASGREETQLLYQDEKAETVATNWQQSCNSSTAS